MTEKRIVLVVLILISLFTLLSADVVEEIVAIVNGDVITLSEYKEQFNQTVQMLRAQLSGEEYFKEYERLKDNLLDMMITDLLLLQQAREKGLNVKEQVKATIEQIKKQNNLESDEDLIRAMRAQGIEYNQWVKQLEENMMRQAVIYTEVDRTIVLDDSEIVQYYKQKPQEFVVPPEFRIKAIYLSSTTNPAYLLEEKRNEISEKLKSGVPFETLVSDYSEGPKDNGGDLGFFKKGELEKNIEQAVEKLKVGEISNWVEARNGWYLVKLEEKKESYQKSFEEARKDIEEKLFQQKRQKKIEEYIKKLREESYIKILKPNPLNL
ncbi:MAG: peptidylprolyl isomerase [Candidatus Aminicenantes bacterium]|nr:peptidylprolyl isomerase [Candidatus Aminicenantes bacterium]